MVLTKKGAPIETPFKNSFEALSSIPRDRVP